MKEWQMVAPQKTTKNRPNMEAMMRERQSMPKTVQGTGGRIGGIGGPHAAAQS